MMSVSKEDSDVIVLEERFSRYSRSANEDFEDADLIVLDSVESSNGSSIEEIVTCGKGDEDDYSQVVCVSDVAHKSGIRSEELESHLRDENILLHNEVNRLKGENKLLQDQLQDLRNGNSSVVMNHPHVQVIFKSKKLAKKYKHQVKKLLKKLLSNEPHASVVVSTQSEEAVTDADIFCVDTSRSVEIRPTDHRIPSYESSFEKPMQKMQEVTAEKKKLRSATCFNCQGDHMLSKCQEPLNQERINENRKNHFKSTVKSPRYHIEKQRSEKYRPGEISEELRSALNLKPDQVPTYIYRMRTLGYPPGWMKEARIESSGIVIYDSEGKAIADENVEEGEVDISSIKVQYDPKKLVSYPGFNIPLPSGMVDESAKLGFPPMQPFHLRSEVEKSMKPPETKAYRKRKLSPVTSHRKKAKLDVKNRIEDDMEIECTSDGVILNLNDADAEKCQFVPPLPRGSPAKPPPPPPTPKDSTDANQSSSDVEDSSSFSCEPVICNSPSLTDLENAKYQLIQELDLVSDEGASLEDTSSPMTVLPKVDAVNSLPSESEGKSSEQNTSLSVNAGTPFIMRHSRFSTLPDTSSFSKGIAEHLCFENLPDSTGQYEKMRRLFGKIKNFQKKNQ